MTSEESNHNFSPALERDRHDLDFCFGAKDLEVKMRLRAEPCGPVLQFARVLSGVVDFLLLKKGGRDAYGKLTR